MRRSEDLLLATGADSRTAWENRQAKVRFRFYLVHRRSIMAPMSGTPEAVHALDRLQLRYQQVKDALVAELSQDRRPAGWRLPPERALAEHFGVSRVTLRRAMLELESASVLARDARGWTVSGPRVGEPPNQLMSFSEMAAARGVRASARVIASGVRPATLDEADVLGIAPGGAVFELERLRSMDDAPILLDRSLIPGSLVPGIESVSFAETSLYEVLEGLYGIRPTRARLSVEAVAADERDAELLDLDPGHPILLCRQVTHEAAGRVIESCEMRYRGDRYRFRATLHRAAPGEPAEGEPQT
jgi:GntR family transcriptional regulator